MQKVLIFMNKLIDFYFDFISPYSYLAHKKILNIEELTTYQFIRQIILQDFLKKLIRFS